MSPQQEQSLVRLDGGAYVFGSREHHDAFEAGARYRASLIERSPIGEYLRQRDTLGRFDANAVAFLARQLTYVQMEVQRILYEELKAPQFVPVRSDVPRGARNWVYRMMDHVGEARVGAHLHADDAPSVDVSNEEVLQKTAHVTASYQFTLDEMEEAAFARVPLRADKAEAVAIAIARGLDRLMRVGDAELGLTGFFNNPNVPVITLTNGEWLTATAAEILADHAQVEQAIITNTRDRESAARLVLPTAYEGRIATLNAGTGTDLTVKEYMLRNRRMISSIERWMALDDATGADVGVADPPQGIAYTANPRDVFAEIPVPYEELPPQIRNFGWVVNARAKFAGVVFKRPLGAAYIENLD